ncbi:MAG: hypothetical protein WC827_00630 [Candidatus Paceibacterota bacterium]|jgi:hypothetical protein
MSKIKNIFENNISGSSYISKKFISPCRDWFILIILLILMIISSIIFDIITYQKIVKGEMYVTVEKEELTLVNLDADKLKLIIDNFEQKKESVSKMKIDILADPSM